MSALGHKRTFAAAKAMSALPPKADMCSATSQCPLCANSGLMHRSKQRGYSVTSSGDGGMIRPSALAVIRLMITL